MFVSLVLAVGAAAPARAQTRLEQAQAEAKQIQRELDASARKIDGIRRQLRNVEAELEAAQASATDEKRRMDAAQAILSRQAASMYRTSGGAAMLAPLLGDGEHFVQRMELVDRVFERQSTAIEDARQASMLYGAAVKRIKSIVAEREKLADSFVKEQRKVGARLNRLNNQIDQLGGPIVKNGKACPVGRPRQFIDSWGFARSGGRRHQGTDIMAPHGTPAYAPMSGTILAAGQGGSLGGIVYWLRADNGTAFYGAHLQQVLVRVGQRVRAGDLIARIGSTGNASATGPHLHFELHPGGRGAAAVNPYSWVLAAC